MLSMKTWNDLDSYLQNKLKDHTYSFYEAWNTIGCGEVILRRYIDAGLIEATKIGREWFLSQSQVNKAIFINHLRKKKKWETITFLAGIYDYLIEHKCECSPETLLSYADKYK